MNVNETNTANDPLQYVIPGAFYLHVKSGNVYRVVTVGQLEADPSQSMVVYQATDSEGRLWIRPFEEFCDGRFQYEGQLIARRTPAPGTNPPLTIAPSSDAAA